MWGIKTSGPANKYFRPGDYIFRENDQPHAMYLIRKGSVAVRKRKGHGEIEIARIHSNEVLGELSFFDRMPRSASAIALTEVEALEITFHGLEKIFDKLPPYFRAIIASVADRLRKADETIRRLDPEIIDEQGKVQDNGDIFTAADALAAAIEAEQSSKKE
jgi:CRP-like cAMP-binding protein